MGKFNEAGQIFLFPLFAPMQLPSQEAGHHGRGFDCGSRIKK
jgi:hypothetical protein